jgi:hypothetical protein
MLTRTFKTVANPHIAILGRMTGRRLQRRPGYDIDVEKVLRQIRHGRRDQPASLAAPALEVDPWAGSPASSGRR